MFLFGLYAASRQLEIESWGWDETQTETFLRMQWRMQARSYEMQYPDAESLILTQGDERIGRCLLQHAEAHDRLIDLSIAPEQRNRGLGTSMLQALQRNAERRKVPLLLSVTYGNPARRLYERLGFQLAGTDASGLYLSMRWTGMDI